MVQAAFPYLDNFLEDWEVATFNGKPASQLSFPVNIDETFYFVFLLGPGNQKQIHRQVRSLGCKTTGLTIHDLSPVYANMLQLIAYSIVLDKVVGEDYSDYDVYYFVGRVGAGNGFQPQILPFHSQRL